MAIRVASAGDLPAIHRIYNDEIATGTATWDEQPWSFEQREAWFAEHDDATPVLVAEVDGELVGFAYLSWYNPKSGYRFTREDTVYVDARYQRRGIGRARLGGLIEQARRIGVHAILGKIEARNEASIALHREFGFEIVGRERATGFKFGRWLDNVVVELLIEL